MWLHRVQQWQLNTFYVVEESVLALLQNPSLTLTSHLRLLWAGEKKFYQVVWVIRNSDSSRDYILRGSEIRNPVPWEISSIGSPHSCTLENQKFSILSCVCLKISLESFWVAFLTPSRFLNSLVEFFEDVFADQCKCMKVFVQAIRFTITNGFDHQVFIGNKTVCVGELHPKSNHKMKNECSRCLLWWLI